MASRCVSQLKHLQIYFCDFTGASAGLRSLLKQQRMVDFVNESETLDFEFIVKRNKFPYVTATYVNGFVKDYPLRNLDEKQILGLLDRARNSCKQF